MFKGKNTEYRGRYVANYRMGHDLDKFTHCFLSCNCYCIAINPYRLATGLNVKCEHCAILTFLDVESERWQKPYYSLNYGRTIKCSRVKIHYIAGDMLLITGNHATWDMIQTNLCNVFLVVIVIAYLYSHKHLPVGCWIESDM